jgi:hypothetical protein
MAIGLGASMVLAYRNPENPLDSVRRCFPYANAQSGMYLAYQNTYSQGQA